MGVRVAVAGASGYAGGELLRLIEAHPDLELAAAGAGANAGQLITELHPNLASLAGQRFVATTPEVFGDSDLVLLALPHGASSQLAAQLPDHVKIVDLGADHRLADPQAWQRYYGGPHAGAWTYGLPELPGQRARITAADRVANTGCYAVAVILALAPLLAAGLVEAADIVVVASSGTSGAGRSVKADLLGSQVMGDLSAYKVGSHQHVAEILQATGARSMSMTAMLAPMPRGILATVTARPVRPLDAEDVRACLSQAYQAEPFVQLLEGDSQPHTAATVGSNSAHLQATVDVNSGRVIVTSAIDNLGKGAAGQAIQNANLMLGLAETTGLAVNGISP